MNCLALVFAAVLAVQTPQDPEAARLRKEAERLRADNAVALRQLEVLAAQVKELNDKLAKTEELKKLVLMELQTAREREIQAFENQRAAKAKAPVVGSGAGAGAALEDLLARDPKAANEDKLKSQAQALAQPVPVPVTPGVLSVPEGKITAVAHEIDLVVISMGADDGVVEGQIYSIVRGGQTIASLKIDRVDRKWAAGKVSKKITEPRVADSIAPEKPAMITKGVTYVTPKVTVLASADELRAIRKELDEVRSQVRQLSDRIVPSWQGAGVSVEEAPEELKAHLGFLRGLIVRRVREGSPAEKAGLKANDVVPDLLEAQLLQAIEAGSPLQVIRQGQKVRLAAGK